MGNKLNSIEKIVNSEVALEAYNDGGKTIIKNTGNVIGTVLNIVDNVILYPLKKLSIKNEHKIKELQNELELKLSAIPEDKICEPDLSIVGPTLEALKYTYDNDELRNLFENLICSNVNSDLKKDTHPRFVEIIKQMSHNDAILFKSIYEGNTNVILIPKIDVGKEKIVSDTPKYISNFPSSMDGYLLSASLSNLSNFGLINLEFMKYFTDSKIYTDCLNQNECIEKIYIEVYEQQKDLLLKSKEKEQKDANLFVNGLDEIKKSIDSKGIIELTDFGLMFAKVCLNSK